MEAICVMTIAYNNIVQRCATDLHGLCAKKSRKYGMENISEKLKALRERAGLSVRDVARHLEFETHSRYAYYESPRYTGDALPLPLARRLAGLFKGEHVEAEEVLALAGLGADEAKEQAKDVGGFRARPHRIFMEVQLPNEASLTRMFDAMLELAGHDDVSGELARTLAVLLPNVLGGTTGEFAGESLDPDFRPWREARAQRRTKARQLPKQ
jgi:transcriptional regulator with XRE-family HTH domain